MILKPLLALSQSLRENTGIFEELTVAGNDDSLTTLLHGIDRLVRTVRHGRFECSPSAMTAARAVVTAEIHFQHDKASFGNPWMWSPVALGPVGAAHEEGLACALTEWLRTAAVATSFGLQVSDRCALHLHGPARRSPAAQVAQYRVS